MEGADPEQRGPSDGGCGRPRFRRCHSEPSSSGFLVCTSKTASKKKPTWWNTLRHSTTSAYSSTSPPVRPGCPLSRHPTICVQVFIGADCTCTPAPVCPLLSHADRQYQVKCFSFLCILNPIDSSPARGVMRVQEASDAASQGNVGERSKLAADNRLRKAGRNGQHDQVCHFGPGGRSETGPRATFLGACCRASGH